MPLVSVALDGPVATVTLNQPDRRNALTAELTAEFRAALADLASAMDPPRCLVVSGAGPVFCAGGDLDVMPKRIADPKAAVDDIQAYLSTTIEAVVRFPAPTIARVHGAAIGAGLGLALACDQVHVTAEAKLGAVQTTIALAPDGGLSYFLPRALPERLALELVQTGRVFNGSEAAAMGLVNAAHADEVALDEAVAEAAALLAGRATRALVLARGLIRRGHRSSLAEALTDEAKAQGEAYATEDIKEGVAAAKGRRPPEFVGR